MKNKLEVINIFKEQIELINDLGGGEYFHHRINTHRSYVADLVEKYIGSQSKLLKYISNENLFDYYRPESYDSECIAVDTLKHFINSCIDFIDKNGIYRPPIEKRNFLGDFDNPTLWVIIPLFSTLLAMGAYWVGRYQEKIDSTSSAVTQPAKSAEQIPKQKQSSQGKDSLKNE